MKKSDEMATNAIIIHSIEHARAALAVASRLNRPIRIYSAEGAAANAGAAWFMAVTAAAQSDHPTARCEAVLDCGDHPGLALAALRQGCRAIVLRGSPAARKKIAEIAQTSGARLEHGATNALDLRHCRDLEPAVMTWLTRA